MILDEVPKGEFFAVENKPEYPKLKLETGYYDLAFGVRHLQPNPEWPIILYTEAQVFEIFKNRNVSEDEIRKAIEQARAYLNVY